MNGAGVAIYFIALFLRAVGIDGVENEQIAAFVLNVSSVIGFVLMVWGQARREDIKWFFWRK